MGRVGLTGNWEVSVPEDITVTSAEIARLAGVERAAVSNWRRRHEDFPKPAAGTASSPAFSLAAVEEWLSRQRSTLRLSVEERLWQHLRAILDDLRLAQVVTAAGAFLLYLETGGWDTLAKKPDSTVAAELPGRVRQVSQRRAGELAFPRTLEAERVPLLRAVAELAAERGAAATFEFLVGRFVETYHRSFAATPPEIAALMAAMIDQRAETVVDPACGTGTLLLAAMKPGRRLLGQEWDADLARMAAIRLALSTDHSEIRSGDSLRHDALPHGHADAVVCNPPFNDRNWGYEDLGADPRWEYGLPPRMESELAWVQHALAHLRVGGTAVLLMPATAAGRKSGRRIRSQLLRRGALRAVIGLPPGVASATGSPVHLWVLSKPARDSRTPATFLVIQTPLDNAERVVDLWHAFRRDPGLEHDEPGVCRTVPVIDLLDDEVDVTPARHLRPDTADKDIVGLRDELAELMDKVKRLLPRIQEKNSPTNHPVTTVAELVQIGVLDIRRAPRSGSGPVARTGDLLISEGEVSVVTEETSVRPAQQVLSADPQVLDPYFLAGFLRDALTRHPGGGSSSPGRSEVLRVVVPRLPPISEQREYSEAFRRVTEFQREARRMALMADELSMMVNDGVAQGRLTVG